MVTFSDTDWAVRKRPASPHDAETQVSKRLWSSAPDTGVDKPLQHLPDQAYPPPLCDAASGWETGTIGGDAPLGYPANNDRLTHLPSRSYDGGTFAGMCFAETRGQACLAGAGEGSPSPSFLHVWHATHLPQAGHSVVVSPLQSPTTDSAGPCLLFAPTTRALPLGPTPASAHGHTHPDAPSLQGMSGLESSYPPSAMHDPLAHAANSVSHCLAPYPEAVHAQSQVPSYQDWPATPFSPWQPDAVSAVGSMTFSYSSGTSSPPTSEFAWNPQPAFYPDAGDHSYNALYATSVIRRYSAPVLGINSQDRPFSDVSLSGQQTLRRHNSWAYPISLPFGEPAVDLAYEEQQPTQHLGPYIEVVHRQDTAQDVHNAFSDIEETVVTDEGELENKLEPVSDSMSAFNGLSQYGSQSQQSRNSSYIHLPHPGSLRLNYPAWPAPYSSIQDSFGQPSGAGGGGRVLVQHGPAPPELPKAKTGRKKRGRFNNEARNETNRTRALKACVACRKQKNRCRINENNPTAPCIDCQRRMASSSEKVIHRWICVRTHTVSSIRITRPGGLGLTRRWEGTKMVDIPDLAADSATRTIHMLQGLSRQPMVVKVRKFRPKDGDITYREWEHHGVVKTVDLEPYCLADIVSTADYFGKYLRDTAFKGLQDASYGSCALVQETFRMVGEHALRLRERARSNLGTERVLKEQQFFEDVVTLVWSMRHTTNSVWLTGEEKLGMTAPDDEDYPVRNTWTGEKEVALPRMIVAQFDSIQNERILPRQLKKVLGNLEKYLSSCREEWFSMYLAVFMLLHEISVASRDRYRWARERRQKTRYGAGKYATLGLYVENFQKASYPLLAYWHYYKCDALEELDWDAVGKTKRLKHLDPDQVTFMRRTVELLRHEGRDIPTPPDPSRWEHELYFVSHMFRRDWAVGYQTFNFMDE